MNVAMLSTRAMRAAALALAALSLLAACDGGGHRYPEEMNMADPGEHADRGRTGDDATAGLAPGPGAGSGRGGGAHAGEHGGGAAHDSGGGHGDGAAAGDGGPSAVSCADLIAAPSDAPVRAFELTAARTELRWDDGRTAEAWTFNGETPGPELRVTEGDRIVVRLTNRDIDKGVTIHWHGVILPCSQDGVPGVTQNAVWPGETFAYEFIAGEPGTFWYHSHQMSSEQAKMGLVGRLVVEPKAPAVSYDRDYAVMLQTLKDELVLTNGNPNGIALDAAPGETVRLRLVNASNRTQWIGVAGAAFRVVSMDAYDVNEPGALRDVWVPIGAGQRYDVSIDMPSQGQVRVYDKHEKRWSATLGEGPAPAPLDPDAPAFELTAYGAPRADDVAADTPFDRTFDLVLGPVHIDGKRHHDIPPMNVAKGDWVRIRIRQELGADHPMHLHGHRFKVLSKNGRPVSGSPIYADSVLLTKGDTYDIAFRADNPGLWMLHCHNLEHAAAGMSMMLLYEGVDTPYRVGTKSGNLPD